jgi:hypothetical protein
MTIEAALRFYFEDGIRLVVILQASSAKSTTNSCFQIAAQKAREPRTIQKICKSLRWRAMPLILVG